MYVATKPVDFRKGIDGLAALTEAELRLDPFSGVVLVFRAKRADRIKILVWDGSGAALGAVRGARLAARACPPGPAPGDRGIAAAE